MSRVVLPRRSRPAGSHTDHGSLPTGQAAQRLQAIRRAWPGRVPQTMSDSLTTSGATPEDARAQRDFFWAWSI